MAAHSSPLRILAIHAHPDDIELQCAGTLALLKQRDCEIVMVTMTAGDCGSVDLPPEEISAIRRREAQASADLLGAQYLCGEFCDVAFDVDTDSRRRVTELIRKARPDIVLTAPPVDYMTDHEVTSRLVRDACFCAPVPNFRTHQWDPSEPIAHIPYLYYVDPIEGIDWFGQPVPYDFIVDISSTFELKLKMLACHDSQRSWLKAQHGMDEYLESCRRWSAKRGAEIGVGYGEAFRQHKGHPYPSDNRLVDLLHDG
jgi:LmbE family N-acetylglucosaminyl deacetylase